MIETALIPLGHFEIAFIFLIKHEGGYSNDKNDSGGETNFGITQNDLDLVFASLNLPRKVKELTLDDAKVYYKSEWWDKYNYESINSLPIATKIFDMAVNMGAHEAALIVQRIINSHLTVTEIKIDGLLGPQTIGMLNHLVQLEKDEEPFLTALREKSCLFYNNLVLENPKYRIFLKDWLSRATD